RVIRKWRAVAKSRARIQLSSWPKLCHSAGFQTESAITAPLRLGNDVIKNRSGHTFAHVSAGSSHRFNFAMLSIEFLQRATTQQLTVIVVPNAPKRNVRAPQSFDW